VKRRSRFGGWGLAVLLAACGAEEPPPTAPAPEDALDAGPIADADLADRGPQEPDVGPRPPASDFPLALGVGETTFVPLAHGEVALLQRGCQGAQHIWVSLHSPALPPADYLLRLSLLRLSDGYEVVPEHTLELPWDPHGDGSALLGVTLVIWDPLPIVEAVGDIYAEVEAPDGRVGRATLRVRVEWGPDAC